MSGGLEDDTRFAFGKNWSDFLRQLDEDRILEAEKSLRTLLGRPRLDGLKVLDIGSGSGLFSLAARRLGATVRSFDYDTDSVQCTRELRERFHTKDPSWIVEQGSVLDKDYLRTLGTFDVVYSWGVLHHTGAMYDAIRNASNLVCPRGDFAFALYRKTRMCAFWKVEKKWYAAARPRSQAIARWFYKGLMRFDFWRRGNDFVEYVRSYKQMRGMDYDHDVHDWLGGYPYESITAAEVEKLMQSIGFEHVRSKVSGLSSGFFGSGCDEYLYRRRDRSF